MQHFGAEGGHFRRLFETDFIDALGCRHHARIGGVDARHVGPDIHPADAERFAEQRGGIVAAAAAERGGAAFRFAADKALGDHQRLLQTRLQLRLSQFAERGAVRHGAAEVIVGAHHFTHVEPFGLHVAGAQDFNEQQGGHQLPMADQLVGQRRRGGQRRGLRQHGDVFQQAVYLVADHRRRREAIEDGVLDATNFIKLVVALLGLTTFGQGDQQVGDARRGGQHHQADLRVGQHDVGAAVHGFKVGDAGAAELGYHGGILGYCLVHVETSCQGCPFGGTVIP